MASRQWGYKPNGQACVFAVPAGGKLPAGWSADFNVIEDKALLDPLKLAAAAGDSLNKPVPVDAAAVAEVRREAVAAQEEADKALRYDENNQIVPPKRRGRPPKATPEIVAEAQEPEDSPWPIPTITP
jgi:hypothetical protein